MSLENDQRTISQFCQQSVSTVSILSSLLMSCFNSNSTPLQRLYDQESLNQVPRTQIIIVRSVPMSDSMGERSGKIHFYETDFLFHLICLTTAISSLTTVIIGAQDIKEPPHL